MITLIFFEHILVDYWKMCHSICVFIYGFNMMVPHHIMIVKCVSGCPELILDDGLVADMKLQFPGLCTHLNWILSIFFIAWIFEQRSMLEL
jgi:hypothetical protein